MCIQYKPTVVACFCILVACKWSNWEIPLSNEKKEWFKYVDPTVTAELLKQLTEEFLVIFEACPSRLKEKIMAIADTVAHVPTAHPTSTPFVSIIIQIIYSCYWNIFEYKLIETFSFPKSNFMDKISSRHYRP